MQAVGSRANTLRPTSTKLQQLDRRSAVGSCFGTPQADAEAKLRRFQDVIAAGVDPLALVDAINEAQEKRVAAQAELSGTPKRAARVAADVYAMIDSLGDVKKVIRQADPDELQRLYEALNVEIVYNATGRMLDASIRPVGRDKASVRGGT